MSGVTACYAELLNQDPMLDLRKQWVPKTWHRKQWLRTGAFGGQGKTRELLAKNDACGRFLPASLPRSRPQALSDALAREWFRAPHG